VNKRIVIVGATSAIAENCARLWVQDERVDLVLVGRDSARLERVVKDLKARSPLSNVEVITTNFLDPSDIEVTAGAIFKRGVVDTVMIAHGVLPVQTECQANITVCCETLTINGISPVLFAEAFASRMASANHGTLVLIGSVAGDRGRKSNYIYGAAKCMVERCAQGLQHRFTGTGVKVILIKPGPTATPMTDHLKDKGVRLAPVQGVARKIVKAVENGKAVVYVPGNWRLKMWIIRHLPAHIFNKLNI